MKKILIVEDDPIVAHIYQTRLEKENFKVEIAPDGQAGFYRIYEFVPDAVLLDLMLPKMNGIEILKKIRAQAQFNKTPIIVFTNAYVPNMIQEAFQAGATLVFNKATLTPRQLLDALNTTIFPTGLPSGAAVPSTPDSSPEDEEGPSPRLTSSSPVTESPFHSGPAGASAAAALVAAQLAAPEVAKVAPVPAPSVPSPELATDRDVEFQSELLMAFMATSQDTINALRKAMQEFTKTQDETLRLPKLLDLYRRTHALTGSAGIAGVHSISQVAAALEVLLKELYEKPKNINASTLRTVAHSIDFIGELYASGSGGDLLESKPVTILVVDDEILSRRAVTYALEKANLKSVSVEDPQTALNLASENQYDLIFLDVQMPNMDGFELCTKIRQLPINKTTPVIFVTSLTDFKSRARSSLSGGTDLIAKPFMFIELSVKALTYLLRNRLQTQNT
jgi:DNA-binding response OmpR family regulator/HPt (histidine-containing phosphotransfer) domain-containing protein